MKIPTLVQYQKAKDIVLRYENEQNRLYKIRVDTFREDLEKYFSSNLLDGVFKVKKFELDCTRIVPINPPLNECYRGGNDEDIAKLCEKHNVRFSIVCWCYYK